MKKILSVIIISIFFSSYAFSQNAARFIKRIEYNYKGGVLKVLPDGREVPGLYNTDSKTPVEKLFFGNINADAEFFVSPSFSEDYGFRLIIDTMANTCKLEIKRVSNRKEVDSILQAKYPSIGIPADMIFSIPKNIQELTKKHNNEMWDKSREERITLYEVETRSLSVSKKFANKLYDNMVSAIVAFRGKGVPSSIFDGESVTFRCVIGDEVWTLAIHEPRDGMKKLADVLKQMTADVNTGKIDEAKYMKLLNGLDIDNL